MRHSTQKKLNYRPYTCVCLLIVTFVKAILPSNTLISLKPTPKQIHIHSDWIHQTFRIKCTFDAKNLQTANVVSLSRMS